MVVIYVALAPVGEVDYSYRTKASRFSNTCDIQHIDVSLSFTVSDGVCQPTNP